MEIRALRESDDRTAFRSGEPDLDRFLQKYASQNQFRHHIGTTYVVVDEAARILAYATAAAGSLEVQDLPARARKNLPQYPLPILRLARLAVDERAKGQGVGKALLRFVLGLALRMAEEYGCFGVAVDAKPGAVEFYEAHGFIPLEVISGQSGARPVPTLMFLSTKEIQTARGGGPRWEKNLLDLGLGNTMLGDVLYVSFGIAVKIPDRTRDSHSFCTYLFAEGAAPTCLDAGDANDDGAIDISDPIALLWHVFLGGGPLPEPCRECGLDGTLDTLSCDHYGGCGGQAEEEL